MQYKNIFEMKIFFMLSFKISRFSLRNLFAFCISPLNKKNGINHQQKKNKNVYIQIILGNVCHRISQRFFLMVDITLLKKISWLLLSF